MRDKQSTSSSEITALAERVANARGRLPLQDDAALVQVLSDNEIDAERELAQWVRAQRRGQRKRAVEDELTAEKRDRRTISAIQRADDADARWHRRALAARRRVSNQDARLAQLYRRAEWSSRALIAVVVLGMVWAGVNVQHNLVPSGNMAEPLYWLSYGIEAMISIPIITIMVAATTAARWGRELDRGKVVFFETALLGTTVTLNAGPHLAAGSFGQAAEYAIAPVMVGVVIWLHAWVSARYALLIDSVPMIEDESEIPTRHRVTTERVTAEAGPNAGFRTDELTDRRELLAAKGFDPSAVHFPVGLAEPSSQRVTENVLRHQVPMATLDRTETLVYHAQSRTRATNDVLGQPIPVGDEHRRADRFVGTHSPEQIHGADYAAPLAQDSSVAGTNARTIAENPVIDNARRTTTAAVDRAMPVNRAARVDDSSTGALGEPVSGAPAAPGTSVGDAAPGNEIVTGAHQVAVGTRVPVGQEAGAADMPRTIAARGVEHAPNNAHAPATAYVPNGAHASGTGHTTGTPDSPGTADPGATTGTVGTGKVAGPTEYRAARGESATAGNRPRRTHADETAELIASASAEAAPAHSHPISETSGTRPVEASNTVGVNTSSTATGTAAHGATEDRARTTAHGSTPEAQLSINFEASAAPAVHSETVRRTTDPVGNGSDRTGAAESAARAGTERRRTSSESAPWTRGENMMGAAAVAAPATRVHSGIDEREDSQSDRDADVEAAVRPLIRDEYRRTTSEVINDAVQAISAEELLVENPVLGSESDDVEVWSVARAIAGRGLSVIPVEQLAEILMLADQSWTPTSIGAEVGLSRSAIAQVLEFARKVRRPYAISG